MFEILALLVVAIILGIWIFQKRKINSKSPKQFVMLDYQKSKTEMLPSVPKDWMDQLNEKYDQKEYDEYDNKHYGFSDKISNQIYSDYKYWEKGESHYEFLSQLHDTQKMYFALINFEGQVNNGGVYQFLFNQTENSIIVLEAMKKAKLTELAKDFEIVLNQFFGKFETIEELKNKFQNKNSNWEKRWNSFVKGYEEIPHAEVIEDYFYDIKYKKKFHQKMIQFVIDNQDELMKK